MLNGITVPGIPFLPPLALKEIRLIPIGLSHCKRNLSLQSFEMVIMPSPHCRPIVSGPSSSIVQYAFKNVDTARGTEVLKTV